MTRIHLRCLSILPCVLFAGKGPALAEPVTLNVPILMRGSIGQDACPDKGHVIEAGAGSDGMHTVQGGPGEGFGAVGRVAAGEAVSVCERIGPWLGVIYGSEPLGCRTTIILPIEQAYSGPCEHGWVAADNVSLGKD